MISIGAYVDGSDPKIDKAKKYMPALNKFLCQDMDTKFNLYKGIKDLKKVLN